MIRKRLSFVCRFLLSIAVLLVALLAGACAVGEAPKPGPAAGELGKPAPVAGEPAKPAPAAAPAAPAASAKPRKLRIMMPSEPNPVSQAWSAGDYMTEPLVFNVFEPLVDLGKKGEPVAKLATKWESSPDLTRWRFYLRKGVKFHNGADFTARDVVEFAKWNIEQGDRSTFYGRAALKDAVGVDDHTVDLIFEDPQPFLLLNARLFLIPPAAISRDNREMFTKQPIGTGPYRFVEWQRGQHIKLARFEDYWGAKPQIDDVQIVFRGEEAVRLAALQAGEVDWAYGITWEQARSAPKVPRIPSPETVIIRFDEFIQKEQTGVDPLFADKRLRLAVDYAIDRQALVGVYGGFAAISLGQLASPGDFGFNPDLKSRPYDLEKAKALVREAGAVGKTLTLMGYADRFPKDREVIEALGYMIEQTGLKVKLTVGPKEDMKKYWNTDGKSRPYMSDIFVMSVDALLEVESRYPRMILKDGDQSAVNDPETSRLYGEVVAELDIAKRAKKVADAFARVQEEGHLVSIIKLERLWGMAKNLEWDMDIVGRPFFANMRFTD